MSVPADTVLVMSTPSRLIVAPFGPPATAALAGVIRSAQGEDPFAPVDVVVPTPAAGVTVRRAIAGTGLANVRFSALPRLAERLAARHLALTGDRLPIPAARTLAVRTALARGEGALAVAAARHRATADIIEGVVAELDAVEAHLPGVLDRLATEGSPKGREAAAIYREYRAALATADPAAVDPCDAAVEALRAGQAPDTHVVLVAPARLVPAERRLVGALAARARVTAILCETGEEDETDAALGAWLAATLGAADRVSLPRGSAGPSDRLDDSLVGHTVRVVVAPDAEEEARLAVRAVLSHLEDHLDGHPVRPERIAIAYRHADPYLRILCQVLDEAGLPYHAPASATLAQTAAGRTLTGLLELHRDDYPRADVIRWLSDAPILDSARHLVPAAHWDVLSREARVSRGTASWAARLGGRAAPDSDDERARRRAEDAAALGTMVTEIAVAAERAATAGTWTGAAAALGDAARQFLGRGGDVARWRPRSVAPPEARRQAAVERLAVDDVLAAVDALTYLDRTAPPPTPESLRSALGRELERRAPTGTTLGRGILIVPVGLLTAADLDLLLVVGMTEDGYPPRSREHPVLRDADRALVGTHRDGTALLTTAAGRRAERRAHRAALAGARKVVLSYATADVRGQRRQFPSPWLLEEATRLAGAQVSAEALPTLDAPWITVPPSFVASLDAAGIPVSGHERDVRLALAGSGDGIADLRFRRGRRAVRARAAGEFGPWLGEVAPLTGALLARAEHARSATALELFATCPASYLFRHVWRVGDLEDVGDQEAVDPRDRGTLVHRALERFLVGHLPVRGRGPRDPDAAWSPEEVASAQAVLAEEAAALEQTGATGRPVLWRAELAGLRRTLARVLAEDSAMRRRCRSWPVAVEMDFGRDGAAPLRLTLDDGREVTFAGSVDRVDRTEDGRLLVIDYKTGKGYGFDAIPKLSAMTPEADLTDRGRKIQLTLYALAAEDALGAPTDRAFYWFVELPRTRRGGRVDETQRARLRRAVGVAVESIDSGRFPAHPGHEGWKGWESCGFCPYDRMCPADRGSRWDRVSTDPQLAAYAALSEGASPTGRDDGPGGPTEGT